MSTSAFDPIAFRHFEATGWDAIADPYHRFFGPIVAPSIDPLLDAARVGSGTTVLDVASGPGDAAGRAASRGASAVGVDIAPGMVALATALHPEVVFREADAEQLPFADRSFDAVVGSMVLPHLARHEQAVAEWVRVLVPGGHLAQVMWSPPDRTRLIGVFLDAIQAAGAPPPAGIPAGPPFFLYATDEALAGLLRGGGLTDITVTEMVFTHRVFDADTFWEGFLATTVRSAALVKRQSPEMQRRIRHAFNERVAEYATSDGLELRVGIKIAAGRKAT